MSTTLYAFAPGNSSPPFQFQPTLDGNTYTVTVTWLMAGMRYYFNVYDLNNNLILNSALIGSPGEANINLLQGYFTTQMIYRVATQNFEISG